jgi:predicted DNA-binding transcriptional regulator YafY
MNNVEKLKDTDFAILFDRDIPTIKRDMQELRTEGIAIHSRKKTGLMIDGRVDARLLKSLIAQYTGICSAGAGMDKATTLLVKKQRDLALHHIVTLQRCIERNYLAVIDYEKEAGEIEKRREVGPLALFSSEGSWRVLALHEGRVKQYLLIKMTSVRGTTRKFKGIPQDQIENMFRFSFRSWTGTETYPIRIRLDAAWAQRIKPQQILESQVISENDDGSVIFAGTVNSLDEFASWVVSKGKGVTVLEPDQLKKKVIAIARGTLANY